MPLASGSFPYRPRVRVAPKDGEEDAAADDDYNKEAPVTDRDPASSATIEAEDDETEPSRAELDAALKVAHEEAESTHAPPPAAETAARSQPGHWLPPSTGDGKEAVIPPHLGKRALILPLDQRPADRHKVQRIESAAPLIGAATAFAAIAL
jgi:hypothetical protein